VLGKVYGTVLFNDRVNPASFPGCWAYPDMSEVGNFCRNGQPCSTDARASEASHWGLWSIVSSPLILVRTELHYASHWHFSHTYAPGPSLIGPAAHVRAYNTRMLGFRHERQRNDGPRVAADYKYRGARSESCMGW
jgi:hypothetical protein